MALILHFVNYLKIQTTSLKMICKALEARCLVIILESLKKFYEADFEKNCINYFTPKKLKLMTTPSI